MSKPLELSASYNLQSISFQFLQSILQFLLDLQNFSHLLLYWSTKVSGIPSFWLPIFSLHCIVHKKWYNSVHITCGRGGGLWLVFSCIGRHVCDRLLNFRNGKTGDLCIGPSVKSRTTPNVIATRSTPQIDINRNENHKLKHIKYILLNHGY